MLETLQNLSNGFALALSPSVLLYAFVGCIVGTLVGVLPGVGPLAGISLLLPVTFGLDVTTAIVLLAGIYYGAMYGGSTTSILMRIPGEAASVMTCIDGYAMTEKGRAGPALTIAAVGSYVAGTASVVALMVLAPPLAEFALRFGPTEMFALLVLGLLVLAYMSGGSMAKALAMAALGLLFGMIGIDTMTGFFRFHYGIPELGDGIGIVPTAVGLFGISEILLSAGKATKGKIHQPRLRELLPSRQELRESGWPIARGYGARIRDRDHPRAGPRDLLVRLVRGGAASLQASRTVRPRRRGGSGRPGIRQQRGHVRAPSCPCSRSGFRRAPSRPSCWRR